MATKILDGQTKWSMTRDADAHRIYKIVFLVSSASTDGPATVLRTPGLPVYGSQWNFDNDYDPWAFCLWDASVTPVLEKEPNTLWEVGFTYSSKSVSKYCKEIEAQDPLLEPPKVSGSFVNYTEEAVYNRQGAVITNSAWERIKGLMFDKNRPALRIETNVAGSGMFIAGILSRVVDAVNAFPLWGLPKRTIKLSKASWDRKYFGNCYSYSTLVLDFDIRFETFDITVDDNATKVLRGHWAANGSWSLDNIAGQPPDPNNPQHFIRFKDKNQENTSVLLDGKGQPALAPLLYISLVEQEAYMSTTADPNFPISNTAMWMQIVGQPIFADWATGTSYKKGNLAFVNEGYYIALANNSGSKPFLTGDFATATSGNPNWFFLPFGANFKGTWEEFTDDFYVTGDVVNDPTDTHSPGRIKVEKYDEFDFLILGVPATF